MLALSYEYFLFACFCVSIPVYIVILWALARTPSSNTILHTSFFRIVVSNGIVDIVVASTAYLGIKFVLWGWAYDFYTKSPWVLQYVSCLGYSVTYSQCIGTILIAFNRYTALIRPFRHQEIWSTRRLWLCIAAQWLIPVAITLPGAYFGLSDFNMFMIPDNGMINGTNYTDLVPFPVLLTYRNVAAHMTSDLFEDFSIISWAITALVVLVIYLRLFSVLKNTVRSNQTNQNHQQRQTAVSFSREMRLLGYGIILGAIQGSGTIFQILLKYGSFNTWYRPTSAMMDFNSYVHPYFLLALSTPLRDRCLVFLKIRKDEQGQEFTLQSQANFSHRYIASGTAVV